MNRLVLQAPLSGWVLPLAQVCDEVFAAGLAGEGVAIDPIEGVLVAPCDGVVVLPGNAKHAISVRHASGAEVLIHVGIDTVALKGEGFDVLVVDGQSVNAGEVLLRFDLDRIARGAKSAVTPVLVASGAVVVRVMGPGVVKAGDAMVELETGECGSTGSPRTGITATSALAHDAGSERVSSPVSNAVSGTVRGEPVEPHSMHRTFRIPFDHGLHARPAAQIVASLRGLDATVELQLRGQRADARSATSMMALGAGAGDEVEAIAMGPQATAALDALSTLLAVTHRDASVAPREAPSELRGRTAAPGLAIGTAIAWRDEELTVEREGLGEAIEGKGLEAALDRVAAHLNAPATNASIPRSGANATRDVSTTQPTASPTSDASNSPRRANVSDEVSSAHLALLEDPELARAAQAAIQRGESAAYAWRSATRALAARLAALPDARMRERAADLRDVENLVLRALAGTELTQHRALPRDAIVFADELLPSQFAALDLANLAGIVMSRGGPTSHVALLAAARGIPTLVAVGEGALAVRDGQIVALEASQGCARIDPSASELAALRTRLQQRAARDAADLAQCANPAATSDGVSIVVHANLGAVAEAGPAVAKGAEGCGLLRTEFLFLDRREAPDEDEQFAVYAAVAAAFGTRPLTIRTLDVGGDKPLAYLPLPREENPALGVRGVRVGLRAPALLRTQLRAILRASSQSPNVRVMLPMVNDLAELRAVRTLLREEARALQIGRLPPLGVMIETPAAALLADQLASEAEFLSIGSNDLSQYVLAIDRGHPELAADLDGLHPAVLRAIAQVAAAGRAAGRSVSVCGGMGSESDALPLLVGLGIREVSAVPGAIPRVKRELRALDAAACAVLAQRALACESADDVRALLQEMRSAATRAASTNATETQDDTRAAGTGTHR